jgi:iron complex outermembrane recepter protein
MTYRSVFCPPVPRVFFLLLGCASAVSAWSQTATTGAIEGRVFNPLTGEYIRNAEVRVQGSEQLVVTEADGHFRVPQVPAGAVTVTVNYTGYLPATATVEVTAGQIAQRNFDLQSTSAQKSANVVELDRFTVSSRREGTAKAIMEQRNSLNVKNVIASDTFGDMMENNIAEVLQYLPGMEIFYCGGDPNTLKMRGMPARYGALMVDGVRTVGTISGNRQPEINAYSANATDTIEYTKTNSADMDADAPAGTVNMKSKSAFQRRGRFFSFQLFGLVNSYELHFGKSNGPNDGETYKTLPAYTLDFSDTYLDGKLGIVVNFSETNSSNEQGFVTYTYNTAPTATSPEPVLLTTINYTNGPKVNRRMGGGLNAEYKVRPNLTFAMRGNFNWEDARIYNRQLQLIATRPTLAAGSNATTMIATPTANNTNRAFITGATTMRTRQNHYFAPSLAYSGRHLIADATYAYLRQGQYARNARMTGSSASVMAADLQLFNIGWTASRPGVGDTDLTFRQTSGPDMYILQNWVPTTATNNINRNPTEPVSRTKQAQANLQYTTDWRTPTFFKLGLKSADNSYFRTAGSYSWTYNGPNGNRLTAAYPVSVAEFFNGWGGDIFTQKNIQMLDRQQLGAWLQEHPEWFTPNPANLTNATNLFPNREARETIDAGYLMGNTRLGRLTLQAGLRHEETKTKAIVYERAVLRRRSGEYDDNFLSGSARFRFSDKLMAIASASQSIMRVDLPNMSGVATINEDTLTGSIPNLDLRPEHGNNYSTRVEYYFEPVGVLSAGLFMMDVKDLQLSTSNIRAEDIGLGAEYPGYLFTTMRNAGRFRTKGFELEYNQQLTFLPGVFRGLGAFANFSRSVHSDVDKAYGQSPHTASAGLSFRYRRLNTALRGSWTDDTPASSTTYNRARTMLGLSINYQLTSHLSLFMTGRNILNAPITVYRSDLPGHLLSNRTFGSNWTFGIKGVY